MSEDKAFHIEAPLIKAGSTQIKLGAFNESPLVDCRVIAEEEYQLLLSFYHGDIEKPNGEIIKKEADK